MNFSALRSPLSALLLCCIAANAAFAATIPTDKSKFKIVLLTGQSNMAGRGTVDPANNEAHPRVVMMNKAGEWVPCVDPIHFDKSGSGVGPGKTFAEALADSDPSIVVGVVPAAVGGTSIASWMPGVEEKQWNGTMRNLYGDCTTRAKAALKQGTLAAILWHQGESDCMRRGGYVYQWRFPVLVESLRRDLGADGVPLIVGGLYPKLAEGWFGKVIANAQRWTCEYAFGPGKFVPCPADCALQPDNIHYTRESQIEFGKCYFAAYQEVAAALKADNNYFKNAATNPAAAIKASPIPGWDQKDADNQIGTVPATLPAVVETWLFPKGRPAK